MYYYLPNVNNVFIGVSVIPRSAIESGGLDKTFVNMDRVLVGKVTAYNKKYLKSTISEIRVEFPKGGLFTFSRHELLVIAKEENASLGKRCFVDRKVDDNPNRTFKGGAQ